MSKLAVTCWVLAVGLAASVLFHVKDAVRALEQELAGEVVRVERLNEEIDVLEAEWAFLNRPERLATLAERHLELAPLEPTQISSLGALPPRLWPEGDLDELIASVLSGAPDTASAVGRALGEGMR